MKLNILFATFFISFQLQAQTDSLWLKKNIKAGMDSVSVSFEKKDWAAFADHMHPSLIELLGGKDKFAVFIEQQMSSMNDASFDKLGTGNVLQLIKYKNQWQCVVESYLQMTVDSIVVSTVSSNVGVTFDEGNTWKFIRVSDGNEAKIKQFFPDISPAINIPFNKTAFRVTIDELLKTYQPVYPSVKDGDAEQ
jgi:hypothetical protein